MGRVKSLDEIKTMIRDRTGKRNIFRRAKREDVESVLANLTSKDPELWAAEWSRVAKPYKEEAIRHEQAGRSKEAREAYLQAYTYYATGRYFEPPLEKVNIPFNDKTIPTYLRIPRDGRKHSVVINFGGIDSFKAES